jgi:hypothetical protein
MYREHFGLRQALLGKDSIIARQSGWQRRVNQDDKGSRSVRIMRQLIVAGKLSFRFFDLGLTSSHAQSAAVGGRSSGVFFFASPVRRPSVKLQEPRSVVTPGPYMPDISVSGHLGPLLVRWKLLDFL